MVLDRVRSMADVRRMVDVYLSAVPDAFTPCDIPHARREFAKRIRMKEFFRVLRSEEGHVVAWINAAEVRHPFTPERYYQQLYYGSCLRGRVGARAVALTHDAIEEEALRLGCDVVLSSGSHYDERFAFARILERHGWERRGYVALRRLRPE